MLYSVRGKLIAIESNAAVVECGGVGYMCQTTMNTLKAVKLNTEVTLYTYLNVREDAVDLFGFATKAELETFKNLISVSGVGPKAGLAVLSELSPEQVAMAIASDDLKTITRAQGIGKKIAQRIVLELKDKLAKAAKEDSSFAQAAQNSVNVSTGNVPKAIEALGVLGYSPSDVSPVLATLDSALPVEQLISLTLKQMGNTFIGVLQRFFKIFGNLKLMPAQYKRQTTHTVIAKDNTPVRVGKAQTHRQLVSGIFNGKWGEHILSSAILSRQSKGKMNNTK